MGLTYRVIVRPEVESDIDAEVAWYEQEQAGVALGDCLKYVGPTTPFGEELQLDATNFSWTLLD